MDLQPCVRTKMKCKQRFTTLDIKSFRGVNDQAGYPGRRATMNQLGPTALSFQIRCQANPAFS